MATRGPWSVKGIDSKAREAALQAARNEGVTLGEYLNRLLLESEAEDTPMSNAYQNRQSSLPSAGPANEASLDKLEQLTRRIEAVEARSTLAITGIDQSVVGLLAKIENAETARSAVEGRVEFTADELRNAQRELDKRIGRIESDDTSAQSARALRSLEIALERMADKVNDHRGETQNSQKQVNEISERLGSLTDHVDTSINGAAERLTRAIEQAESRSQGAHRLLTERMSQLETEVSEEKRDLDERFQQLDASIGSTLTRATAHIERYSEQINDAEERIVRTHNLVEKQSGEVSNIAERLTRAETITDSALKELEAHYSRLDQKLSQIDRDLDGASIAELKTQIEERIRSVSHELADTVAEIREDIAEQIEAASNAPADAFVEINNAVVEMHKRMKRAEKRQADAIEALGGEFAKLTQALDRRVSTIEQRNDSELTSAVREQIDRLTTTLSSRIAELETRDAPTESLTAITSQMQDLASSLDKRVHDSEERSAAAIRDFTDHVTTLTKKLSAKQDQGLEQISNQIRDSEKRQSDNLDKALSGVKERIAQVEEATAASISPIQRAMSSLAERLQSVEDFATPPGSPRPPSLDIAIPSFRDTLKSQMSAPGAIQTPAKAEPAEDDDWSRPLGNASSSMDFPDIPEPVAPKAAAAAPAQDDDPWASLDAFEETEKSDHGFDEFDDGFAADVAPAGDPYDLDAAEQEFEQFDGGFPSPSNEKDDYISRARAAARAGSEPQRSRKGGAKPAKSGGSKVPLVAAASVLALTAAGTVGYMMMRGKQDSNFGQFVSVPSDATISSELTGDEPGDESETLDETVVAETEGYSSEDMSPEEPEAYAAEKTPPAKSSSTLAPLEPPAQPKRTIEKSELAKPTPAPSHTESATTHTTEAKPHKTASPVSNTPPAPAPAVVKSEPAPSPAQPAIPASVQQFQQGMDALNSGNIQDGVALIQASAEAGQPMAQYRLSKLYERGQGVPRDISQSRLWTERAANGGNVKAMHDLAVFYAEGEGGQQSYPGAVQWFRKAADHGLVDSQYNLGVLYEQGLGVTENKSEALYWFRVANKLGDRAAATKVAELVDQVSAEDAERTALLAGRYRAQSGEPEANGRFPGATSNATVMTVAGTDADVVREVQKLLGKLGYPVGVADGDLGPQTQAALISFQSTNDLPTNGKITPELLRKLRETTAQ